MRQLISQIWKTRDVSSLLLLVAILAAAAWNMALPVSEFVQESTLKRFHLATTSFSGWAIQQPIPSMYNFENRYWSSDQTLNVGELRAIELSTRPGKQESEPQKENWVGVETHAINHFPARTFTFAFSRNNLSNNPHRYIYLRSRYRGKELSSSFRTRPISENEIRLERLESTFD